MGVLYLIRHGQASIHGDNYDVLSERGHVQALALGHAMAREEPFGRAADAGLTRVVTGPLERQKSTTERILEGYQTVRSDVPVEVNSAFSEYPAFEIFAHAFEALRASDPEFAALAAGHAAPHKSLPVFAALIGHWADGTLDLSGTTLETYVDFVARVERGVAEVLDGTSKTDRIAVVTSGGPIGIAVGHVLGLPPRERIRLCWRIANASLTRIERHPSDGSLMLAGMNSVSHLLPDERTWV